MSDAHRLAEGLMAQADAAAASGNHDAAVTLYLEAGRQEVEAFRELPAGKLRTRGVLAVSAVSLTRQADADEAVRLAYSFLADRSVTDQARSELEMIVDEVRTEQLARVTLTADGCQWSLRGGRVGFGFASIDSVSRAIEQIQRLAWRVWEMLDGRTARIASPAPAEVREAVELMVGQPVAGSFTFNVRLATHQLPLFDSGERPSPEHVAATIVRVLEVAQDEEPDTAVQAIPDPQYRDVLLKMVRNMAPDGRDIGEISVRRLGSEAGPVVLTPATRAIINRRIGRGRGGTRGGAPDEQTGVELRDLLQVIDLNRRRIGLGPKNQERWVSAADDTPLADLVEGLEGKRVIVRAHRHGGGLLLHDIEPDAQTTGSTGAPHAR